MASSIARVVLYKHGMACFERRATVTGDTTLPLTFRHEEMDDALKSLAVVDLGGGQLASVAYDPHPALVAHLDDIRIELPRGGGLVALMGQLIGAEVTLHMGGDQLQGRILGIEKHQEAREKVVLEVSAISVVVDGALRRVRMADVDRVEPVDEALKRDLAILLQRMDTARRASRRRMHLDLRGEGDREVLVSYTVPSTVWKTSYRVIFEDDAPTLLGFALVDNDSPDDWKDVELSLVAGLPISFTHDLYSPRRRDRPHVRVETEAPIAPPVLEGAVYELAEEEAEAAAYKSGFAPPKPSAAPKRRAMAPGARAAFGGAGGRAPSEAIASSTRVETRTQEAGDQFRYDVATPVSIDSGHSALVPILSDKLEGELVAVYNERVRKGNPLTAFRLKNTSSLTLEGGPATVFQDGEYAGEAMIDTMRPDEERLVPFCVALGCRITTAFDSHGEKHQDFTIADGYLIHTHWTRQKTTYTIRNVTDRDLKIYLDHAGDRQAEYIDTPDPAERTETFDRFIVEVSAKKQRTFEVTQRLRHKQTLWISPEQLTQHMKFIAATGPRPELTRTLRPLLDLSRRISSMQQELERTQQYINEINGQHARIRENLKTLGTDNKKERELRERYVTRLDTDETRLAELQGHVQQLQREIDTTRKGFQTEAKSIAF